MNNTLKLYVVINSVGKYFRTTTDHYNRKNWVDDINSAKFYAKIGQAKSRVTYFFKHYPELGCPSIIEITCANAVKVDMQDETKKKIQKSEVRKLKQENARKQADIRMLEQQQRETSNRIQRLQNEL